MVRLAHQRSASISVVATRFKELFESMSLQIRVGSLISVSLCIRFDELSAVRVLPLSWIRTLFVLSSNHALRMTSVYSKSWHNSKYSELLENWFPSLTGR